MSMFDWHLFSPLNQPAPVSFHQLPRHLAIHWEAIFVSCSGCPYAEAPEPLGYHLGVTP